MSNEANKNPWIVRESGKREDLPVNQSYFVAFNGVEDCDIPLKSGEKLPKWRFLWEVKTGPCAGKTSDTLTDRDISPNTLPGRLIAGLIGKAIKGGDDVEEMVKACVGQDYIGTCKRGTGNPPGKACIREVSKPPQM